MSNIAEWIFEELEDEGSVPSGDMFLFDSGVWAEIKDKYVTQCRALSSFLDKVRGQAAKEIEVCRQHGFVFDDLDDRWQKLAFTFYTDIAALSVEAEQLIEFMKEQNEGSRHHRDSGSTDAHSRRDGERHIRAGGEAVE